ncbi:MAG: MFS transporter [Acidimicrobiales bacterium]|nr:MFS transporter [Acidimicrobiales bacterium]
MDDPALGTNLPHGEAPGRLVTSRFAIVTAATFAYFIALGALLPTLPRYVEDELGGGGVAVGVVIGSFAVSAAAVRPWAGRLGDRYGRRVLLSGGSFAVAASVAAYALVDSLVPLVALRLVTGLGEAAVFVGAATAIQDLAPDDRRGEAASYFSVALYGGLALGPALGEGLAEAYGFHAVWLAAAGFALLAAVLGLGTPKLSGPPARRPTGLLHRAALGPGFVLLLGLIPFAGFSAFLSLYGEDVGIDDVGPVFGVYAGTVLVIRILGARLPDRLGWRTASSIALVAVGLGALLLAAWASVAAVWVSAVCIAIGMSLLFPALFSAAMAGVPEDERSHAVGTFSLFFDLSQGLGAPVLGLVVALSSYRGAFAASAVVAACGWFAQVSLSRRRAEAAAVTPAQS